jgi:hypothetical protein
MAVSFLELVGLIAGVSLLVDKKTFVGVARRCGKGFGTIVGKLQGSRLKVEEQSKGTKTYALGEAVKSNFSELRVIPYDILGVFSSSFINKNMMPGGNDPRSKHNQFSESSMYQEQSGGNNSSYTAPVAPMVPSSGSESGTITSSGAPPYNTAVSDVIPDNKPNQTSISQAQPAIPISAPTPQNPMATPLPATFNTKEEIEYMARLIVAEEQLQKSSRLRSDKMNAEEHGSDIVQDAVSSQIMNRYLGAEMMPPPQPDNSIDK